PVGTYETHTAPLRWPHELPLWALTSNVFVALLALSHPCVGFLRPVTPLQVVGCTKPFHRELLQRARFPYLCDGQAVALPTHQVMTVAT
ncbi:hypothetical protein ABK046_47725, partial [Streptomyces caeruleatus]